MAHWAMHVANEMGYFPNKRQAVDIGCRAAYLYAKHFDGAPPRGHIDDKLFNSTAKQAVEETMQKEAVKARKPRTPKKK
ncbi:MAG TPA: hypothetical protein VGG19_20395 [Tepidisphaeraceae bacterium]|jgi:hypothetical protein